MGERVLASGAAIAAAIVILTTGCVTPTTGPGVGGGAGGGGGGGPTLAGCHVLPADNAWNTPVSSSPVRNDSSTLIANISTSGHTNLHADFGGGGAYGI